MIEGLAKRWIGRRASWRELERDYLRAHSNPMNHRLHLIGVPLIAMAVLITLGAIPALDVGLLALALLSLSYVCVAPRQGAVASLVLLTLYLLVGWMPLSGELLWTLAGVLFLIGVVIQLYGHKLEGNRPAFLENLAHLWVAPMVLFGSSLRSLRRRAFR